MKDPQRPDKQAADPGAGLDRSESPTPALRVRGLSKSYEQRTGLRRSQVRALSDVSFELRDGEVLALVGESGSGKSTTARLLAQLEPASAGSLELFGQPVSILSRRRPGLGFRSQVQMIFQDPFASLNPVHRVGYHIARPLICHKKYPNQQFRDARVLELLEQVGLNPAADFMTRYPHELSGGQRQRVAIARALAVEPKIIIADEPTSMLDVSIRIEILNLLRSFKRDLGISFIYITHDLATARYFADRIAVLYAGRIVEEASAQRVLSRPSHPYTKLLLSAVPDIHGSGASTVDVLQGRSHINPSPRGCAFAPRCPDADHQCRDELPAIEQVSPEHRVRCHVYGQPYGQ